jgi:glycosyltransferase involved in cell wall biosynthesis
MKISGKKIRNFYYSIKRLTDKDTFVNPRARGDLKFGVCLLNRFTIGDKKLQVMGDELQARAIAREVILHCPQVKQCRIYDIKEADKINDDIVFVMWAEYPLLKRRPKKYAFWLQNAGFKDRMPGFLKEYDYVFSPSKKRCAESTRIAYLPMACEDTDSFKRAAPEGRFESDVCFVGNFHEQQRPSWLQKDFMLPAAKYNFGLWGSNWERSEFSGISRAAKGRLEPRDIPAAYSSAKIVLSNHWLVHRDEEMVTTRIYEALACEAFVISDHFGALDEFRDHVVFTSGGKDLEDKLEYYLSHPEKRQEKARGAREFILKNHTFKSRVEVIAKEMGLEFT